MIHRIDSVAYSSRWRGACTVVLLEKVGWQKAILVERCSCRITVIQGGGG